MPPSRPAWDLHLAASTIVVLSVLVFTDAPSILRLPLTLSLVLLIPGYLLLELISPRASAASVMSERRSQPKTAPIATLQRSVVSVILSLVITTLVVLGSQIGQEPPTQFSVLVPLSTVSIGLVVGVYLFRGRREIGPPTLPEFWHGRTLTYRSFTVAVGALTVLAALAYAATTPRDTTGLEVYFENAASIPRISQPGDPINLSIVLSQSAPKAAGFTLTASAVKLPEADSISAIPLVELREQLEAGERRVAHLNLTAPTEAGQYHIVIELILDNEPTEVRQLRIPIEVSSALPAGEMEARPLT